LPGTTVRQILTKGHKMPRHTERMACNEEECPINVVDSDNIQQLDIRVVKSRYCNGNEAMRERSQPILLVLAIQCQRGGAAL